MRALKVCTVLGFVLAVSGTAGAITFNYSYSGALELSIDDWESGTIYLDDPDGNPVTPPVALPTGIYGPGHLALPPTALILPGPGNLPGEDGWGVFRVKYIKPAKYYGPNDIQQDPANPANLWEDTGASSSDGKELIGIFWNIHDIGFEQKVGGGQTLESGGFLVEVYEQPHGTWNLITGNMAAGLGSAGRLGPNIYKGVGYDALGNPLATASVWLSASGSTGKYGINFGNPVTFLSNFDPLGPAASPGSAFVDLDCTGGTVGNPPSMGIWPTLDSDFYTDLTWPVGDIDGTADIRLRLSTTSNNPGNVVAAKNGFDWTVSSTDDLFCYVVVPEPVTMLSIGLAVVGLGGYIRRRRIA